MSDLDTTSPAVTRNPPGDAVEAGRDHGTGCRRQCPAGSATAQDIAQVALAKVIAADQRTRRTDSRRFIHRVANLVERNPAARSGPEVSLEGTTVEGDGGPRFEPVAQGDPESRAVPRAGLGRPGLPSRAVGSSFGGHVVLQGTPCGSRTLLGWTRNAPRIVRVWRPAAMSMKGTGRSGRTESARRGRCVAGGRGAASGRLPYLRRCTATWSEGVSR